MDLHTGVFGCLADELMHLEHDQLLLQLFLGYNLLFPQTFFIFSTLTPVVNPNQLSSTHSADPGIPPWPPVCGLNIRT